MKHVKCDADGNLGRSWWQCDTDGNLGRSQWQCVIDGNLGRGQWHCDADGDLGRGQWQCDADGDLGRSQWQCDADRKRVRVSCGMISTALRTVFICVVNEVQCCSLKVTGKGLFDTPVYIVMCSVR